MTWYNHGARNTGIDETRMGAPAGLPLPTVGVKAGPRTEACPPGERAGPETVGGADTAGADAWASNGQAATRREASISVG